MVQTIYNGGLDWVGPTGGPFESKVDLICEELEVGKTGRLWPGSRKKGAASYRAGEDWKRSRFRWSDVVKPELALRRPREMQWLMTYLSVHSCLTSGAVCHTYPARNRTQDSED